MMVLLGSQAAKLTGCLPPWRGDEPLNDYDVIGDEADFDALARHFRKSKRLTVPSQRTTTHWSIRVWDGGAAKGRILIDFVSTALPSAGLIAALPDNVEGEVFGLPCLVISPLTQRAIKMAYSPFPVHREKNVRDLTHWREAVSSAGLTSQHVAVMRAIREEWRARTAGVRK